MSEQQNNVIETPTKEQQAAAFNKSVDGSIRKLFEVNREILTNGEANTPALILANALSASDLCAGLCVEAGTSKAEAEGMMTELFEDMKRRLGQTFDAYTKVMTARQEEAAND